MKLTHARADEITQIGRDSNKHSIPMEQGGHSTNTNIYPPINGSAPSGSVVIVLASVILVLHIGIFVMLCFEITKTSRIERELWELKAVIKAMKE